MGQVIVLDLEIALPVTESAMGWDAARNGGCGMSCVVIHDSVQGLPTIYDMHTIDKCVEHIENAERVVTFNGKNFDAPCLSGVFGRTINFPDHYDLLEKIWVALGKRKKGYGLNDVCMRTLGRGKINHGANAPKLFAEGRFAELHSYCLSDVYLTKALYNWAVETGWVRDLAGHELWLEQPLESENESR